MQREIRRAPRAFPMVKRPNGHIDHRRVKTVLPYFERRWDRRRVALDDPEDPLRPGDVIFMDTFPGKPGPDHVGILSDRRGPSGMPLVINSWTDGFRASEMDLLPSVPVTHRFRYPIALTPPRAPTRRRSASPPGAPSPRRPCTGRPGGTPACSRAGR